MPAIARRGLFRAITHQVPDPRWWMVLTGPCAIQLGMAGWVVEFAVCGAVCPVDGSVDPADPVCPACFPTPPP